MKHGKFDKQEIRRRLAMTPPAQYKCWACREEMGEHLYDCPLNQDGEGNRQNAYTIRIACDKCKRKLEQQGIFFYN